MNLLLLMIDFKLFYFVKKNKKIPGFIIISQRYLHKSSNTTLKTVRHQKKYKDHDHGLLKIIAAYL